MITARTQVREILKEAGMNNQSEDFMEKLDEKVREVVLQAAKRAKDNGRRTVMGRDI